MMNLKKPLIFQLQAGLMLAVGSLYCKPTTIVPEKAEPGKNVSWSQVLESVKQTRKGPLIFRRIKNADWQIDLKGLVNLDDPEAVKAGLKNRKEPIQIYLYEAIHSQEGRVYFDTGVGQALRGEPGSWPIGSIIRSAMDLSTLKIHTTTQELLSKLPGEPAGVFITHLHLDHIMGASDFPDNTPFYVGPGEADTYHWQNLVVQGSVDRLLGKNRNLKALEFGAPENGLAALDFFGDGSLFVFHSPGHTPGSLAFLIRATDGAHLVLGDTSHTAWGWKNNVPPGSFTMDQKANRASLNHLKELSRTFPDIKVYPGHQSLD